MILEYLVGLDNNIGEHITGARIYDPKVSLDNVVLPKETKVILAWLACVCIHSCASFRGVNGRD